MKRLVLLAVALAVAACTKGGKAGGPLRVGHFPNVTHAQALVGASDGTFAKALGGAEKLQVRQFNAGPAEMEALLAGDLDVAYVGPGPATIAYLRSKGALKVVAGAVAGGASLVVKPGITAKDLPGRRVASPQLGNTQDVALRVWLAQQGLKIGDKPGEVNVTPLAPPDILQLFSRGDLAGAWVPEPWAARLVHEAGAATLLDERDLWPGGKFPTTIVVASARALKDRRAEVVTLVRAHAALTARWREDPKSFAAATNAEFGRLTGRPLSDAVLADAFSRLEPSTDVLEEAMRTGAEHARSLQFAPEGDLAGLVDPSLLRDASATASGAPAR
jgi:NitT/TauT family transport system substrate-binding protein